MDEDTISSDSEDNFLSAVEVEKFLSDLESYNTTSRCIPQAPDSAAASAFSTATSQQEQQPAHVREAPQLVALLLSKDRIPSGKKVSKDEGKHSNRTSYATVQLPERSSVRSRVFHKCNMCKLTFTTSEELLRHKANCNMRWHECPLCEKICVTKPYLERHLLFHSKKKPFCEICHVAFKYNSELKRHKIKFHEKTNADVKTESHTCEMCQMSFTHRGELLRHNPRCDGRPYKCGICRKRFKRKAHLVSHLVVHSNERPYQCQICDKTFKWRHQVNEHGRNIHLVKSTYVEQRRSLTYLESKEPESSNRARYAAMQVSGQSSLSHGSHKCDSFETSFINPVELLNQTCEHIGKEPYECEICQERFETKATFTDHLMSHMSHCEE